MDSSCWNEVEVEVEVGGKLRRVKVLLREGGLAEQMSSGNNCRISVCRGSDGEDRNDSREVLIRTSHMVRRRRTGECEASKTIKEKKPSNLQVGGDDDHFMY